MNGPGTLPSLPDTIVAIATPPGAGAIGVIRLSGPRALALAGPLLRLPREPALAAGPPRTLRRATIIDPATGAVLDEALVVAMPGPGSYTGEDVVELSCHGSPVLLAEVLRLLVAAGARLAEPGEFTRRAYLNGRLDLVQAEAVAELIGARTERAVRLAARALRGGLSSAIDAIREEALELVAGLEVELDFPEEDIGVSPGAALKRSQELAARIEALESGARSGRVVEDGLSVALAGAPNVGKSSLLNALLGRERAIVAPSPGTTRDLVEGALELSGVPVRLVDGAGLGRPQDAIDAEGMRRARRAVEDSDLVLVVLDRSRPVEAADREVLALTASRERLVVASKSDLSPAWLHEHAVDCAVSALTGAGIGQLMEHLAGWVRGRAGADAEEGGIVASVRAVERLAAARAGFRRAAGALAERLPVEAALVDLREGVSSLDLALGIEADDAVLDRIFARFCVGK